MPRRRAKCPPGNLCIDNTLFFLIIILVLILLFFISRIVLGQMSTSINIPSISNYSKNYSTPNFGLNTIRDPRDTLSNPYVPPLRNGNYFRKDSGDPRGVPINIPTRGFRTEWKQKGILTRLSGEETILPLMARPLYSNRQKWQYYTMSDKNNSVKLPVVKNGKSCTNEYGCDEIFSGDNVYVEGYNDTFKATVYENNSAEYIPFL
jgi:hypothetical protein